MASSASTSIVLTTLSVFLGLFFVFVGSMKVTPMINREMHREIRRNFVQYAKVFPLAKELGFKIPSKYYRLVLGWLEVICGATLVLLPGIVKQIANAILLVVTCGAFYTHTMLGDKFERIAPSIVFSLMLSCRLIIFYQIRRKQQQMAAKTEAPKHFKLDDSMRPSSTFQPSAIEKEDKQD